MDDDPLAGVTLEAGTHLLGVSPPMVGARSIVYRFVARGLEAGEGCVVVTTDRDTAAVRESVAQETDAGLELLGVVDATGRSPDGDGAGRVTAVGSPADLTGIGIGLTGLVEALHDDGADGYRVVLDSLSSLLVYADFERLYQFAHTVRNQVGQAGGRSLFLLSADTDQEYFSKLEHLFDGVFELREHDGATEYRRRGVAPSDGWQSFAAPGRPAPPESPDPDDDRAPAARTPVPASPESLAEVIETVEATGYTLTVCNYRGDEATLADIEAFFARLNVTVRSVELPTATPTDTAILHRGSDPVAASPVGELHEAVRLDDIGEDADAEALAAAVRPAVLEHVYRREYTVENGGKLEMVRISRLVETRALDTGAGTLHTGFQRLDRVRDELGTQELYENLATAGVDVHLYGQAGAVPNEEWYTIHAVESGELADAWFVVYDGAGEDAQMGALVSEETGPEAYSGFWTYQPAIVRTVDGYLRSAYG